MEEETLAKHSQPAVHIPHGQVIPLVILSYLLSQVHLNVSNNFTLRGEVDEKYSRYVLFLYPGDFFVVFTLLECFLCGEG